MEKGIALQGYVPIIQEPSENAATGSQLLFGETCTILDSKGIWHLISHDFDGFQGWVTQSGIYRCAAGDSLENKMEKGISILSRPITTAMDIKRRQRLILPAGSLWPATSGAVSTLCSFEFEIDPAEGLIIPGNEVDPEEVGSGLISIPSVRGGRCGFGFDGPGLVQMLCRMMGFSLPRFCQEQSVHGTSVNFMNEVRKGDLAFFDNDEGEIMHVGMAMDAGRILHSYRQVRIDRLDHQGIYDARMGTYTHRLRIIKRIKKG